MSKAGYFRRGYGVSFLTAFMTLAVQILVCRIISAKLLNNYAFLVIALTMLGFAVSGVLLAFNNKFLDRVRRNVRILSWLFVLTLIASTFFFYHISLFMPGTFASRTTYVLSSLYFVSLAGFFVVPFICSGLIFRDPVDPPANTTRTMYCFDLMGSALRPCRCFFISCLGVEKSLLVLCGYFCWGEGIIFPVQSKMERLLLVLFFFGTVFYMPTARTFLI